MIPPPQCASPTDDGLGDLSHRSTLREPTVGRRAPADQNEVVPTRTYTVSVTLAETPSEGEDLVTTLRHRLTHLQLSFIPDADRIVIVMAVEAADLWLAVLVGMHAVTATGYEALSVAAEPARTRRPPATPTRSSAVDDEGGG